MTRSTNVRRFVLCSCFVVFRCLCSFIVDYFRGLLLRFVFFFICLFFSFISFLHAWRLAERKLFCLCYVGNLKKYSKIRPPIPRTAVVLQWHCALPKEILLHWPVPFSLPTLQTAYKKRKMQEEKNIPNSTIETPPVRDFFFFFSLFVQTLLPYCASFTANLKPQAEPRRCHC